MNSLNIFRSGKWAHRIQAGLVGLILGSIVSVIIKTWGQIYHIQWHFNFVFLLFSIFIVTSLTIAWAFIWSWLLRQIGGTSISMHQTVSVYIYGNASKYIPGSVWNYMSKAYLGGKAGYKQQDIWIANIIEFIGSIVTGFIIYQISFFWPHTHALLVSPILLLVGTLVLFFVNSPIGLEWFFSIVQVWRKKKTNGRNISLKFGHYCVYILVSCLIWSGAGVGFYLFLQSFYSFNPMYLPQVVGIWSFVASIGLLAIGFPQGFGIKEGLLILLLSATLPFSIVFSLAILSRAWTIFCDLLALLLWGLVDVLWFRQPKIPGTHPVSIHVKTTKD